MIDWFLIPRSLPAPKVAEELRKYIGSLADGVHVVQPDQGMALMDSGSESGSDSGLEDLAPSS